MEIFAVFIYQDIGGCPLSISPPLNRGKLWILRGLANHLQRLPSSWCQTRTTKGLKGHLLMGPLGFMGWDMLVSKRLKFASLWKKGIYNMGTGACSLLSKVFALVCWIPMASLNLTCCVVSVTCSVPAPAVQPAGLLINVLARLWKIQNFVWVAAPELGSGKC